MQEVLESQRVASLQHGSEPQFRRLLEVMPAAAYTTDATGLITYFNRRAVEVWGREPQLNDPIDRY